MLHYKNKKNMKGKNGVSQEGRGEKLPPEVLG